MSLLDRSHPSGHSAVPPGNSPAFLPPWFSVRRDLPGGWFLRVTPGLETAHQPCGPVPGGRRCGHQNELEIQFIAALKRAVGDQVTSLFGVPFRLSARWG